MRNLLSDNGFVWFLGVVEDRNDPIQLGRVRVRCFGFHTDDKDKIPTNMLPWAVPMQGITSAALNGMGHSPTGLVEGSWIVGFFLDGERAQEPVVMGSIGSIPSDYGNPKKGFNDPRPSESNSPEFANKSKYPKYINESDVNRLARHTVIDDRKRTITSSPSEFLIHTKKDSISQSHINVAAPEHGFTIALSNSTPEDETSQRMFWDEPKSTDKTSEGKKRYQAEYPKNHVYESESGHIVEYDDTEGAERIHQYHAAGTFYEIDDDGNKHTRVVANNYTVVLGSDNIYVQGDVNLTIDSNCRTLIKGHWDVEVQGNKTEHVKGTYTQVVDKNVEHRYRSNQIDVVDGNVTETYGSNQTTKITGNLDVDAARIDLN